MCASTGTILKNLLQVVAYADNIKTMNRQNLEETMLKLVDEAKIIRSKINQDKAKYI